MGYNNEMAKVQWIDILKPDEKDLKGLGKKFGIHPVILDELRGPSTRSHAELYKNYIYLVYYFPIFDPVEEVSVMTEVDFLITKNSVITVRYENLAALQNVKHKTAETSIRLTYHIIQALIHFQERQLRHVREKTEAVGRELFKDREKEVLKRISKIKRDVSEYRLIVRHQGPILRSLMEKGVRFGNEEDKLYLSDLMGDYIKVINQLDSYREAITDFEDTNNQLMYAKTTEVMRTFTTLSFLTFPFMLIAAIFSMNIGGTPLVENPLGFWIVFMGMIIAILTLATYFKKRGWI